MKIEREEFCMKCKKKLWERTKTKRINHWSYVSYSYNYHLIRGVSYYNPSGIFLLCLGCSREFKGEKGRE